MTSRVALTPVSPRDEGVCAGALQVALRRWQRAEMVGDANFDNKRAALANPNDTHTHRVPTSRGRAVHGRARKASHGRATPASTTASALDGLCGHQYVIEKSYGVSCGEWKCVRLTDTLSGA